MKKEIWAIFVILGIIFSAIFLFSVLNKRNPALRKSKNRARIRIACGNISERSSEFKIRFTSGVCKLEMNSLSPKAQKKIITCLDASDSRTALFCASEVFCKENSHVGCLLKMQLMAKTGEKRDRDYALGILASECETTHPESCQALSDTVAVMSPHQVLPAAFRTLCVKGVTRYCNVLSRNIFLEKCVMEDIDSCAKETNDAFQNYFSCETGNSVGCSMYFRNLTGLEWSSYSLISSEGLSDMCVTGNSEGCYELGLRLKNSKFLETACNMGSERGCLKIVSLPDIPELRKTFLIHQSCMSGNTSLCTNTLH